MPATRWAQIACLPLTITSSPDPSTAGQNVTISGRFSTGASGVTVTLWQKLPGATKFVPVATTKTGSSGQYQFVRSGAQTNRQWYVTAQGDTSVTINQQVKAVVKLTRSLVARTSPNHAGELALLVERTKQRWTFVERLRVGSPALPVHIQRNTTVRLRAVFLGDKRNIRSVSNIVVLTG
jgi:hypothetical protein